MPLTSLGMFFSGSLGTLSGQSHVITVLLAGLFGLVLRNHDYLQRGRLVDWHAMPNCIPGRHLPTSGWHAGMRGALVFAGGEVQVMVLLICQRIPFTSLRVEFRRCYPTGVAAIFWRDLRVAVLQHFHFDQPGCVTPRLSSR